ncbi:MAG: hypothetical protein U0414_05330 [Polyangiaceae bacterium]
MPRTLPLLGLVGAVASLGLFGTGCYATVAERPVYVHHDEAVVWVDGPPVADYEVYPCREYYGTRVYWVNGLWWYMDGPRWAYYRTEPQDLYVYRTSYIGYWGPTHHHPYHETSTVYTTHDDGAPQHEGSHPSQHHSSSTPAPQPASSPAPARPVRVSAPPPPSNATRTVVQPVPQPQPAAAPAPAPKPQPRVVAPAPKRKAVRKSVRVK